MFSLAASVACSVAVSVLLKVARRQNIRIDQAIAVNYPTAALLCLALLRPHPEQLLAPDTPWWVLILLGVLLPSVFVAMAGAVHRAGIVVSDASQRLSLLIPLAAAFFIFGEAVSGTKLAGMAVALCALACLLWQTSGSQNASGSTGSETPCATNATTLPASPSPSRAITPVLLLCVWAGYGIIDILFKQMARSSVDFSSSLFASFVLAGILLGTWLVLQRTVWQMRSVVAGLLLGLLNFSNIYFYLSAHQAFPENPTLVFAAMNIGVISLGTIVGAWVFREGLPSSKGAGLILAVAAIYLLMPR